MAELYLSRQEADTCRREGVGRARRNRHYGNRDLKVSPQSGFDVDFYGRIGEKAFARWAGTSDAVGVLERPDAGHDFLWSGRTIDVKCSRHIPCHLLIALAAKQPRADILVQFGAQEQVDGRWLVKAMGWTSSEFWMRHYFIKDMGHGKTRILPRWWLYPMEWLRD